MSMLDYLNNEINVMSKEASWDSVKNPFNAYNKSVTGNFPVDAAVKGATGVAVGAVGRSVLSKLLLKPLIAKFYGADKAGAQEALDSIHNSKIYKYAPHIMGALGALHSADKNYDLLGSRAKTIKRHGISGRIDSLNFDSPGSQKSEFDKSIRSKARIMS